MSLKADIDEPKTLKELHRNQPGPDYQNHHIVEQTSAEQDGFPRSMIDSLDNQVIIPTAKHREISAWYQTKNPDFDYLSPRDYLRDKDWEQRYKVGITALVKFKVLKP